jgi:hypothetical protein
VNVLHAFDGPHVLGALECSGIGATELAHAALHLRDRLVLVSFHPLAEFALDVAQVIHTVTHEGRAHHGDVRSDHEQLYGIFSAMDSTGAG